MKPVEFKGWNVTFAKDQHPYLPLPAFRDKDGKVTICYHCNFWDRIVILFKGKLWFQTLTFNKPIQPQKLMVKYPN